MRKVVCGILAHVDAGKTTLSEALLYQTGMRRQLGRVDHRDAFLDTHDLERSRGITIFSKLALLKTGELDVTLVDTPGHVDFSAEAERTMPILDCAILVINGTDGVQAHTLTLWDLLRRYRKNSAGTSWISAQIMTRSRKRPPSAMKRCWSSIWRPARSPMPTSGG